MDRRPDENGKVARFGISSGLVGPNHHLVDSVLTPDHHSVLQVRRCMFERRLGFFPRIRSFKPEKEPAKWRTHPGFAAGFAVERTSPYCKTVCTLTRNSSIDGRPPVRVTAGSHRTR